VSNVVSLNPNPTPSDEAASWIAKIDAGALSAQERGRLEKWLAIDPLHSRLLDEHALTWKLVGANLEQSSSANRPLPRRLALGFIAASLAVMIGWFATSLGEFSSESYVTGVGETRTINLADGSRIAMNTNSELVVRFRGSRRTVVLDRGEAIFNVAHDTRRPFEVLAAGYVTRAVGTRFAVRAFSTTRVAVVVTEGSVTVRDQKLSNESDLGQRLAKRVGVGERALTEGRTITVVGLKNAQLDRATSWANGGIAFRDEPLGEVLAEVNRYAPKPVRISDPALATMRVSGYLATSNVDGFVSGLSAGTRLQVRRAPNGATIISSQ
jgi:transmembrane sensor